MTVQPAISAGISLGMIRNCGTFQGTIAPTTPDRCAVQVHFAEHAVAALGPREVAGDPQGEVDHRHRCGGLTQPAETARRAHLVGDQVGHLVEVAAVDGRELLDLAHAFLRAEPRPRSMVEGVPSGGNRVVDVRGRRRGNVANRTFGVRGDRP